MRDRPDRGSRQSSPARIFIFPKQVLICNSFGLPEGETFKTPVDDSVVRNEGVDMKKKDLGEFRKLLDAEKEKILRHLENLSNSQELPDVNVNAGDSADIASVEINQANLQKIGKRETYLLKKIEHAIAKIDDGNYGVCEICGEDISAARLKVRPVAQLCIDCKQEQENLERRFSGRQEEEEGGDQLFEEGEEA